MKIIKGLNTIEQNKPTTDFQRVCPSCGNKHMNYFKAILDSWKCSKCKGQFDDTPIIKSANNLKNHIYNG